MKGLGDVVIEGTDLIQDEFRRTVSRALERRRTLKDAERTVYPNGAEQTIGHRDGLVVLDARDDELELDETQTAEMCGDLLFTALRAGATDWRIRAAHHLLRDIHDEEVW